MHLTEAISSDALITNVKEQMTHLLGDIDSLVNDEHALKILLSKISQVVSVFPEFDVSYKEACKKLVESLKKRINEAQECIEKHKFEELRKSFETVARALALQEYLNSLIDIKKEIENLENLVMKYLEKVSNEGLSVLKKAAKEELTSKNAEKEEKSVILVEKLNKSDIDIVQKAAQSLESAVNAFECPIENVNLTKPTQTIYDLFFDRLVSFVEKIGDKISSLFEKQRYDAFEEIKAYLLVMEDLRKVKEVEQRTQRQYFQLIEKIFGYVREVQKDVDLMLPLLTKQDATFDYNRLFECVMCVHRSKWIEERQERAGGGSTNLMDTIKEKLVFHLRELQEVSQQLELDLDHPEHLEQGRKIVFHLEKMRRLEEVIPEMASFRKDVSNRLENTIRETLFSIQNEFSLEKKSVNFQIEIKQQLEKLKSYAESLEQANAFLKENKFETPQALDYLLQTTQKELAKTETNFEEKMGQFQSNGEEIQKDLDRLDEITQKYKELNKGGGFLSKKISPEATNWLSENKFESIQDVDAKKKKEQEKANRLQEEAEKFDREQKEYIERLQEKIAQNKQIKEKYENLRDQDKGILEDASKFLKNQGFSESEITRLANNEKELGKKFKECEAAIAEFKNLTYKFETVNAPKTEKVLNYLKEWKTAPFSLDKTATTITNRSPNENEQTQTQTQIQTKTTSTLKQELGKAFDLVERFLYLYGEFVGSQMRQCLAFVADAEVSTEKDDVIDKVEIILSRLKEITKLQKNHQVIFKYYPQEIKEQFDSLLKRTWLELEDKMMLLKNEPNHQPLRNKIAIAKALSILDECTREDCKFRDLFVQYQKAIISDVVDTKAVMAAIEGQRYPDVLNEMLKLEQRKEGDPQVERVFEEVKNILARSLKTFSKSTYMKVLLLGDNSVDIQEIMKLGEQLQINEDAKNYVFQYVDTISKKEIESTQNNTKYSIEKWIIKFLNTVKVAVNSYNFVEAEERIKDIRSISRILGNNAVFEENKEELNKEGTGETIRSRVDELENQLKSILSNIVKKYKDIKLSDAQFNPYTAAPPKELYAKLKSAMERATTCDYKGAWGEIEEDITRKVRDQLVEARKIADNESQRQTERCLRVCDSILHSLPEHMQVMLKDEIKVCREDIENEKKNSNTTVQRIMETRNINDIRQVLDGCKPNQEREIRNGVEKMAQDIGTRMEKQWIEEDTTKAFASMEELFHLNKEFQKEMPGVKKQFTDGHKALTEKFDNHQKKIISNLESLSRSSTSNGSNATIAWLEKTFDFLIACIEVRNDNLRPTNFHEKMKNLNKSLSDYIVSLQHKFEESMKNLDTEGLNVLDTMKVVASDSQFLQKAKFILDHSDAPIKMWTYTEMVREFNGRLEKMTEEIISNGIINDKTKLSDAERDNYFGELKEKLVFIKHASELKNHVKDSKIYDNCIKKIGNEMQELIEKVSRTVTWDVYDLDTVNICYNCFDSMQKNGVLPTVVKPLFDKIDSIIKSRVAQLEKDAMKDLAVEKLIPFLLSMKEMSIRVLCFKDSINKRMDELLSAYKRKQKDGLAISMLALQLEKDASGIGETIVAEHTLFKGYSISLFNVKTKARGIEHVLEKLEIEYVGNNGNKKGNRINITNLGSRYNEFHNKYQALVKEYLNEKANLTLLANNTKMYAGSTEQIPGDVNWNGTTRGKVTALMAHVFTLWTLQNAQYYWDAKGVENQQSYLLQPQPAQVISIFCMLGIDDDKQTMTKNLVQIGTGEGKSVTLAVASAVLALLGFDVSCASYSEYLSSRDFQSFESLFTILGVTNHIHYGTFNKLCERIINDGGDVRKRIENLIFPTKAQVQEEEEKKIVNEKEHNHADDFQTNRAKILLIDEVDVFFNKEFYGSSYSPAATLRHDTITQLINLIWKEKDSSLNLAKIKQRNEYKACCNALNGWDILIDEAIKDMLYDVQNYQSHDYQVSNDKIGYKEQDSVCFNVRYGYKTLFAYYHEQEQQKISEKSLKENIFMSFQCGKFSYAEIPKNFDCIMGVSGTLKTLSTPEREVVETDYKVAKYTYMPSLFGESFRSFTPKDDIRVVEKNDYFTVLKKVIDDRLVGKNSGTKRAVLVFFESKKQLAEFLESSNFADTRNTAIVMTEENTLQEKEAYIKRATTSGQVSLFTRSFGRGTDFVCRDQIVASNGGIHVIQTFLSEELSEEEQIKGRTARQGNFGSYSMVLCESELEKFSITKEDVANAKSEGDYYPMLDEKRTTFFKAQYAESKKYVEYAEKEHKSSELLIAALKSDNVSDVKKLLCERNKGAEEEKRSRTIVLMDATGSMSHLLQKAKHAVSTMFEQIAIVLKENGKSPDSFEMQFAVYRNYNAPEDMLLQTSPWESKPENLRNFMEKVEANYGLGDEAIEIGLAHVNRELEKGEVAQVILIGDAPANTRQEVISRRNNNNHGWLSSGESYWSSTKLFSKPTYYEDELQKLKTHNVPVHAFFVHKNAKENFAMIAASAGPNGRCELLDINSENGADQLTNLVSEEVLRSSGGDKGNELVEAYRAKFSKSYT